MLIFQRVCKAWKCISILEIIVNCARAKNNCFSEICLINNRCLEQVNLYEFQETFFLFNYELLPLNLI